MKSPTLLIILLSLFTLFFLITACKKEEQVLNKEEQTTTIEPEFQKYVDRFFAEAEHRDVLLTRDHLEVVFQELEGNVCGYGYARYNNTSLRRIEIDPECWEGQKENFKEWLIFHELGHAILKRGHLNNTMPNGLPKSLMCGVGPGFEECASSAVGAPYSFFAITLRNYYLDELFDIDIPLPSWSAYKARENGKIIYSEDFEGENSDWYFRADTSSVLAPIGSIIFDETNQSTVASITSLEQKKDGNPSSWVTFIPSLKVGLFKESSVLKLQVTTSTKNLEGTGAVLILRVLSGSGGGLSANEEYYESSGAATTQGIISINGNRLEKHSVEVAYYPSPGTVRGISIELYLLADSKGTVSFDDLELVVYE